MAEQRAKAGPAEQRVLWVLGSLFAVMGLVGGGYAMHAYLTRPGAGKTQPGQPEPKAANAGNTPLAGNTPAAPGQNAPVPAANRPAANAPSNTGAELQPVEPDKHIEPPLAVLVAGSGASLRVKLKGAVEYTRARPGLAQGDALKLERGEAGLRNDSFFSTLSRRGEVEVVGAKSLRLLRGRLAVRALEAGVRVECEGSVLALAQGEYVVESIRTVAEADVVSGSAVVTREEETATALPGTKIVLARGLQQLPINAEALKALQAEVDAPARTLLRWDFETGYGDCDLGRIVEGGVGGGRALQWDPTQAGAGTSLWKALFTAGAGTRVRVWVLTDAAEVDITMRLDLKQGVRATSARLPVPAGQGWRMIDVPLSVFKGGRKLDQPGLVEGGEYSGLQFSVPPSRDELLVSRPLTIDAVQVYTLE